MNKDIEKKILEKVKPYYKNNDPAHDFDHMLRVLRWVKYISKKEGGDLEIMTPAAIMHDLITFEKNDLKNRISSDASALLAKGILEEINEYPSYKIERVYDLIRKTSYTKNISSSNLEIRILQDADRIEAVGAIGVSRAIAVCGKLGIRLYDPKDPMMRKRSSDNFKNCIDFMIERLLNMESRINTETAKKIVRRRIDYVKKYLDELESEINENNNIYF